MYCHMVPRGVFIMTIIDLLLDNAGASITYRTKRDILDISPEVGDMKQLQQQILLKPRVRKILANQHEDGWIGNELHGIPPTGFDSNIWFLLNYGVERDHPALQKAVNALLHPRTDASYKATFAGGHALDEDGRGGHRSVFAVILTNLQQEHNEIVASEVALSLDHFRAAISHTCLDDFSTSTRSGDRRYYKPGARFPGANHVQVLSRTKSWRTLENVDMVRHSFACCMNMMKKDPQYIMFKHKSHFIGPFNFGWAQFPFSFKQLDCDSYAYVWWLRTLDDLSTIGFVRELPELAKEYEYLKSILESGEIYSKQTEKSLQRYRRVWAIEDAWRNKQQVIADLYFMPLLILKKAGYVDSTELDIALPDHAS